MIVAKLLVVIILLHVLFDQTFADERLVFVRNGSTTIIDFITFDKSDEFFVHTKSTDGVIVVESTYDSTSKLITCEINNVTQAEQMTKNQTEISADLKQKLAKEEFNIHNLDFVSLKDECEDFQHKVNKSKSSKQRGLFSWMFIFPGTKWCGAGNVSKNYDDLGTEAEVDKCCREHDYCNESIDGLAYKYGYTNYKPMTMSHCRCDYKFKKCLKAAEKKSAKGTTVGRMYFDMFQQTCFTLTHRTQVCAEKYWLFFCKRYEEKVGDAEPTTTGPWNIYDENFGS